MLGTFWKSKVNKLLNWNKSRGNSWMDKSNKNNINKINKKLFNKAIIINNINNNNHTPLNPATSKSS